MQFLNPLFLIGLVAVAVPIVVHLFNFRRYKKVYFSNVELLQQLENETQKQSKLKHLLVLALRIMCIIFIVLAFAQPIIPTDKSKTIATGTQYVSVYIDNSFSMEATTAEGTKLDMAKQKAHEIAAAYSATDRLQLITNDIEGRHFRFVSPDDFSALVDEVAISPASANIANIIDKQYSFLGTNGGENKSTYIISDFQRSTTDFAAMSSDSGIAATTLIPIPSTHIGNIYIDSASLSSPILQAGSTATLYVHIHNTGNAAVEKVPVKLFIEGKQRALASADLPARSSVVVPINFNIDHSGTLNGKVTLNDYPIVYDDEMFFSLNVQERIHVLVINGGEENPYLNILFGNDSAFVFTNCNYKNIDFDRINSYNTIIVNELKDITSSLAQTLRTFVANGGTVVVGPSVDANVESYNAFLVQCNAPTLANIVNNKARATLVNAEHRLYNGVFDKQKKTDDNIETLVAHKYFGTRQRSSTIKESVITLENGDDFLSLTPLENGSLYLFATALNGTCTDFAKQALFVPTLYNMALQSHPAGKLYHTIGSSNAIHLQSVLKGTEIVARLSSADGKYEVIPEIRTIAGKSIVMPHNQVKTAGNYTLKTDDKDIESLAFNYNRAESETDFTTHTELVEGVAKHNLDPTYIVLDDIDKPISKHLEEERNGTALWKYLMIAALLTLLAEVLVIRFFKI